MRDIYFWRQVSKPNKLKCDQSGSTSFQIKKESSKSVHPIESYEVFILFGGLLCSLSIGFMLGFPSILKAAIMSPDSDIYTTEDHATWINAINGVGGIIGSLTLAPILQIWGRKAANIVKNLCLFSGWITFAAAKDVGALYAARFMQGLVFAGVYTTGIILGEYVHPSRRGTFVIINKTAIAVGILICHSMAPFWTWRQIALYGAAFAAGAIILTFYWPESPAFLAFRGRFEDSERAFKWLNGDTLESQRRYLKLLENRKREEDFRKNLNTRPGTCLTKYLQKNYMKALLIVVLMTLCLDLCGKYYFITYITDIMTQLVGNNSNALYFTVGSDTLTIVALILSSFIIRHFNRRTILFYLGGLSILLMFTVSLIVFLYSILSLSSTYLWFTAVLLIIHTFIVHLSVIPLSYTVISEILPLEFKGIGLAAAGIIFTIAYTIILKITPILMKNTKLYGTYAIYGVALLIFLIWLYKILPETKDKTLEEIEDNLNDDIDELRRAAPENNALITK